MTPKHVAAQRVYLVCHSYEEGYVVESVWATKEAAESHIKAKRWERDVMRGLTWIYEEIVNAA